ncbi:endonuclease/exonuclease/phosphatase family protein [Aegicerativicinus sediminis]|uniref:endonuclease/exonuclease/phosphatase family protein n=1 Tax=Aegicerativicinus sediminis TaxID=2893202 RepID=UPI001E41D7F5|nr:endonuclease/exonuclease/phosphatase family protein [Aegicerativicinus sediminis]
MKLKRVFEIFGIIAIILTVAPIFAIDYWWIRMFDFPHIQLTLLTLLAIIFYLIKFNFKILQDYAFISILIACFIFQFIKIYPYTPLAEKEVGDSTITEPSRTFTIYNANVLQKNRQYDLLIEEINTLNPDILILTETDVNWQKAIKGNLSKAYKFGEEAPLDNTYGMLVYSKLPLSDSKVNYLIDDSIPSVEAKVKLPSGDVFQLYAIHPTPPMPQENPKSTDRDAEMMKTALFNYDSKLPSLVIGDFNDVTWSKTTKSLKEVGKLLDLRKGRGFYTTFNAKNPVLRWPLDHIFVSEEFRVKQLKKGEKIGSDHFPYYATLTLEPERANEQLPEPPSDERIEFARKQIAKEKEEETESKK